MTGYTKLFGSILESTVWLETPPVKVVWITLLAMADRDGCVEASVPGLAKRAGVDRVYCEQALALFLAPDPDSRTKTYDGRRIEPIEGGWRLLNYEVYRERASAEEAREKAAARKRRQRERAANKSPEVTPVSLNVTYVPVCHPIAEAKAEAKAEEREKSASVSLIFKDDKRDAFTDPSVTERAGRFIERYQALYQEKRRGARYAVKPGRDYQAAVQLCETWPDERLDKLAACFLTTDHKFAAEGSRTLSQFLALASWCDGELAAWEQGRQA